MWHLHYFSSFCYYCFSFYLALALFLFLLLLLVLLLSGTCTISLPSAIIPSPSMWQLHYFSSFCYYFFSFYAALALTLFLLLFFLLLLSVTCTNSIDPSANIYFILHFSSFLPFSPPLNHNLLPLSLPLSAFAYSVTPNLHSYYLLCSVSFIFSFTEVFYVFCSF